jgi:hypothetical protein
LRDAGTFGMIPIMSQGAQAPIFGVVSALSAISGVAHAGTPVIITLDGDVSKLDVASDSTNADSACVGLLIRPCAEGDIGAARYAGPLTLEVDQWNQLLSDEESPDGLQPGKAYYLNDDDGKISVTQPEGAVVQRLGTATSQVTLLVAITGPNDINEV